MGFSHDKIFRLILLLALLVSAPLSAATDDGVKAELHDFVMPHYRNNKLQFVLYGEKGINLGAIITFTHPLIDIVTEDLPAIEFVKTMEGIKVPGAKNAKDPAKLLYPLNASEKVISAFWDRYPHSQAVIASEKAEYDKNNRLLSGDGPVHFRSRELDIDGVGFDADQRQKFVHIRSKVQVVIHPFGKTLRDKANQEIQKKKEELKNIK